ncbi:MAG: 4-hydroxybenzoate 3-monooxygenase, partial [Pseudomonadota bacterium]
VILERRSRTHVLDRIRAGILERGTVALLHEAGAGERLARECFTHDGTIISHNGRKIGINFKERTGHSVTLYGQTELTRDLYDARDATGAVLFDSVERVDILGADTDQPSVRYGVGSGSAEIRCDYVVGCDGFHGVSRRTIPEAVRRDYERIYPFGWLGVLSETPPVNDELIYASSERGFALCSMRNAHLSRYYIQCDLSDAPENWPDAVFWDELRRRIPEEEADRLVTGPSIEKSIAPLRSFVTEPMRWGRLFLCGDAAHIVPPTGAKGLNTAASDVHYLARALIAKYAEGDDEGLSRYSEIALARVWKAERFSWATTNMLHRYPDMSEFDLKIQAAEIDVLETSAAAQTAFAENYVGLPF